MRLFLAGSTASLRPSLLTSAVSDPVHGEANMRSALSMMDARLVKLDEDVDDLQRLSIRRRGKATRCTTWWESHAIWAPL
jgi:hypothetical protein